MKSELLPSASTAQATSNVLTKFRIQMIHLAFSYEHFMNILTWTFIQFSFWTMRASFLNVRPNIPGMFHECYRAHWVRTDTHHSPPICQRSLICTQAHDHVRKIEIARYCRHEGIPWVIYRSLVTSSWPGWGVKTQWEWGVKTQWELKKNTVRFRKKTSKKKKKNFQKKKIIWKKRSKEHWDF